MSATAPSAGPPRFDIQWFCGQCSPLHLSVWREMRTRGPTLIPKSRLHRKHPRTPPARLLISFYSVSFLRRTSVRVHRREVRCCARRSRLLASTVCHYNISHSAESDLYHFRPGDHPAPITLRTPRPYDARQRLRQ